MCAKQYRQLVEDHRWQTPETFNFGADVVDAWARNDDHEALIWTNAAGETRRFKFSDIAELTDRFASVLQARGLSKGDRIIIMLPRSPEWMVAMVAASKAGLIAIPCIEMLTARDLTYRVLNSQARGIVCRGEHAGKFAGLPTGSAAVRIALDAPSGWLDFASQLREASGIYTPARLGADEPAIMYYTSGSTGSPKGVLHASRALHAWRYSAVYWLDLKPTDTIWCTADTGWSKAGTSILFGPWSCGARVFLYDGPFDPIERVKTLIRHAVTVYCAPATELSRVADAAMDLESLVLRRVVSAGEAVSPAIASRWQDATGLRVDEGYGQTEALMLALNYPGEAVTLGSMGRPAPGCDLAVIDDDGRRLPPDMEGDLALGAPNPQLMLGYWQEPERTESCFRNGPEGRWYLTGDRARVDGNGYLWYCGRSDDVINSAGYRIGPTEVESVLSEHPSVESCAVVGRPDSERGEIVTAYVVLRPGYRPSPDLTRALQDHAKKMTAPYKYPRAIEFIDRLPMTPTGKIRRRELRDRERRRVAGAEQ
jgi:acetyl-CoA synthetase